MNALHYASQHGYEKVARLLVDLGINMDTVDSVSGVATHPRKHEGKNRAVWRLLMCSRFLLRK